MNNKYFKRILLSLALLGGVTASISAQGLRSSYFLEGATYRHQLNPAFTNESNYISILPFFVLGNLNVGVQGNIGLNDFLYPYNQNGYDLTTFMNPQIGTEEFLSRLHKNNHINLNIDMSLLSFGFRAFGGFNTFDIRLRSNSSINIPYSMFNFMKSGMTNEEGTHYNIKDLAVRSNNYVELALGHSREILDDRLTVGAKVKFLFGGANVDARIENMDLHMSQNEWHVYADGVMNGSLKGAYFETDETNSQGHNELSGFDVDGGGLGGFGLGFDLGAVYKMDDFVEGLTLSASLLDLGFIHWNNTLRARTTGEYTFAGFKLPIVVDGEDNDPGTLDNQLEDLGDDLADMFNFYEEKVDGGRTTALAATLNIGAEYALPWYKKLRFGFLSSTYFNRPFTWSEGRFSANVAPVSWFEASVNYACSSFGSSLGWVLNFHPNGFNFFIGTDHMITRVTPQYIPVGNANATVSLGFNITFGKKKNNL